MRFLKGIIQSLKQELDEVYNDFMTREFSQDAVLTARSHLSKALSIYQRTTGHASQKEISKAAKVMFMDYQYKWLTS